MSHKNKICETALASHIETCHEQCNYTPLIVSKGIFQKIPENHGLKKLVESDITKNLDSKIENLQSVSRTITEEIKDNFDEALNNICKKTDKTNTNFRNLKTATFSAIDNEAQVQLESAITDARFEIINESNGSLDLSKPEKAIESLSKVYSKQIDEIYENQPNLEAIPFRKTCEYDGLGFFFKESVCYRSEGLTYMPCGEEMTILPGEEIKESNVLKTTISQEDSAERTTSENLTNTDRLDENETFTNSYDRTVRKETDIKLAREASFKASIPFKVFNLDLSGSNSGSFNFNKVITEVNKSSHATTKDRFSEVVRELATSNSTSSSRSFTSSNEVGFNRSWVNNTDVPKTFIRRKGFCKTSVLHRRHNIQLAWTGCIDVPARDLCTPNNIEEKHAADIQAIHNKWKSSSAPSEYGARPKNMKRCTGLHSYVSNLGGKKHVPINDTIPAGWYYDGGAQLEIVSSTTTPQPSYVSSQPNIGAEGGISFDTYVDVKNKLFHEERATVKVCYIIAPQGAKDWDFKVNAWRNEQAQKEIDAFISSEIEDLNQFLATDQARASIERRIMEDYFGVTPIDDCCKLIARLRKLFDFDNMCYSLLPAWNEMGEGCQRAFPVNLYTAKCLHFYIPINPGMEIEAVELLASVNAIPWSLSLGQQILAYIQQIQNMRNTLYNRLFDPTGWDVKFDQPYGYEMTPYDTTNPDWESAFESNLNYELLGAFTINVPSGGERIDSRPSLCGS